MKVIRYKVLGRVPSKKNSRITNRKTGRSFPSKRYSAWHKNSMEKLKEIGLPTEPIKMVYKCVVDVIYPDYRKADNTNKAESVHDLLVDAGILSDDNNKVMPHTEQIAKFDKTTPGGFVVKLFVDENHPENKDVNFKQFPVMQEMEVKTLTKNYRK